MALFCTGFFRVNRAQLLLYCSILSLIIYFLHGRRDSAPLPLHLGPAQAWTKPGLDPVQILDRTPWGAPIVWGESQTASWRRARFSQAEVHTVLLTFVVGNYAPHVHRFLSSAETHFLPGRTVTYYVLTDNPRTLDPPPDLAPNRSLKVVPIAELPGWDRLYLRRTALIADTIQHTLDQEVDYIFCLDVDLVFVGPVGEEIFGDLVGTLHPELYGRPRAAFPFEFASESSACIHDDEGELYYTSEFYGGSPEALFRLVQTVSRLILQDQADRVRVSGLEESYLNRVLVDLRPALILSPEYSWWDGPLTPRVPVPRVVSRGRQCEALDMKTRTMHRC